MAFKTRKPKGITARLRAKKARTRRTTETAIMNQARERDIACRFSGLSCCSGRALNTEVAHQRHRGMGGNAALDRTTRQTLLLLCPMRHRVHTFSVDRGTLRWEAVDPALGTDGPIRWYVKISYLPADLIEARALTALVDDWLLLATESAPHEYLPLTEEQAVILRAISIHG